MHLLIHAIYKTLKSFTYAFKGIWSGFSERNMRVHGIGAVLAVSLGIWLKISLSEWFVILLLIGAVFAAELINTAIEELANCLRDECHLPYRSTCRARDIAAGAVLVLAIVAAIIGVCIFGPKILIKLSL
jgi:diacylglycerol kinase